MTTPLDTLTELAREIQQHRSLEDVLQLMVERAATLLDTPRVSVRLLDATGSRLLAVCRAGSPLHIDPAEPFDVGEGLVGWIVEHRAPIRTGDAERDERFAPRRRMRDRMGSYLGVPLVTGNAGLGVVSAVDPRRDHFTREHQQLLTLLAVISAPFVELARLSRLAAVDPLTGALNRRGLERVFPTSVADVEPLSVAMADIDEFKRVNDTFGHATGDQVLKQVARILDGVLRKGDVIVRYGGEEFLMLLPAVDLTTAGRVLERAREAVEAADVALAEVRVRVTVSFGVAQRRAGESREAVINRADAALYRAKAGGRNRVVLDA